MKRLLPLLSIIWLLCLSATQVQAVFQSTSLMMYHSGTLAQSRLFSPEPLFILELSEPAGVTLPAGATVLTATEHYLLVSVTSAALEELENDPSVKRLQPSRRLHPVLNESRTAVNIGDSWSITDGDFTGYSGRGVILGTVDTGIDPQHYDFFDADSNGSRILMINDYDTDRLWTNAEIAAGNCTSRDTQGHGTHVASIMAGNGNSANGRLYAGIAPGSDLIVVKSNTLYTGAIVEGVDFVFSQASSLQRPAVVNLSLESRQGPHDGTSLFEQMLSELTGPGRLLTVAVGNAGDMFIHNYQELSAGWEGDIRFTTGGEGADYTLVDIWIDCSTVPELTAIAPDGGEYPVQVGNATPRDLGAMGVLQFARTATPDPGNHKYNATFYLDGSPNGLTWRIHFQNNGDSRISFDAWSYNGEFSGGGCTLNGSVSTPATADSAIAVGAYVSRISWPSLLGQRQYADPPTVGTVAPFSNRGPGINGALIPTLVAPGMGVMAALSAAVDISGKEALIAPGGNYILMQGTSMAAPQVAGALALALQRNPQLGCSEALELLRETASLLSGQSDWDEAAGGGLLDVTALLANIAAQAAELRLETGPLHILLSWVMPENSAVSEYILHRELLATGSDTTFQITTIEEQFSYSWLDTAVIPLETYEYYLAGYGDDGSELWRSGIVAGQAAELTTPLHLKLYPNPSDGNLTVQVVAESHGAASLFAWDILGRKLLQTEVTLAEGITAIPVSLTSAGNGIVFIGVEQAGYRLVQKGILLP